MNLLLLTRKEINAAGVLVATTTACAIAACMLGDLKACLLIVVALVGQLSMLLLLVLAHRARQRVTYPRTRKYGLLAALLAWCSAKAAIILVAIAIGIGVGLIGWAGVKIMDAIIDIEEHRVISPKAGLDENPEIVGVEPGLADGNYIAPGFDRPATVNLDGECRIAVPAGAALEMSYDNNHWTTIFYGGETDSVTWWAGTGVTTYFRLRSI